jgi:hypothetical protein
MSSQVAYRLGDGAPVALDSAHAIWAAVAREILEQTPSTASITPSELARQVQQRSGVQTRMPASEWLPTVLVAIGDGELTARVRADDPRPAAGAGAKVRPARQPRGEPRRPTRQEAPPAICPTCYMQLPASGRCDTCA